MLKRKIFWFNEADPTKEAMEQLQRETQAVIADLLERVVPNGLQMQALHHLKDTYEKGCEKLPDSMLHGKDNRKWEDFEREERVRIYTDTLSIKRSLQGLDFPDMRAGYTVFSLLALLLAIMIGVYVSQHDFLASYGEENATLGIPAVAGTADGNRSVFIQKKLRMIGIRLAQADDNATWQSLSKDYDALRAHLPDNALSYATLTALGSLGGTIELRRADDAKTVLTDLKRGIEEDFNIPPSFYLWTQGAGKWMEIVFWSIFGVLIGLMFYVSKRLNEGLFDAQEIPTMAAEVLMAPIVVSVIFFLLDKTEMTEISTSGEMIFVVLGFAFLLGYAIRRAVGILDNLKKRLLPDP